MKQTMGREIVRIVGLGLFAAVSWYIPLRAYADWMIQRTKFIESRWPPLLLSYFVWYVPFVILLLGAFFIETPMGCSSAIIVAILWAYIGHNLIQGAKR